MGIQLFNPRFRLTMVVVVLLAGFAGIYALSKLVNSGDNTELLPQQQKIPGYVQKDFEIPGKYVKVYHPEGFQLELLSTTLPRARFMHFHGDRLFIGSKSGIVFWLDPPYYESNILITLKEYPHSVVVHQGYIYIAQTTGVFRAPYSDDTKQIDKKDLEKYFSLPGGVSHNSRTIKIGPDNNLYVSIGFKGNCKNEYVDLSYPEQSRRGGIFLIDQSGEAPQLIPFASGLRNPVGYDWHPETKVMYATNNGPDHLGYEQPPEYFAKLTPGSFHGMPWYQFDGEKLVRDKCADFDPPRPMDEVSIPVATFPAHNAPLGVEFVPEHAKAKEYYGDAIVALHGSWMTDNDTPKGDLATRRHPKLVLVKFEGGEATSVQDLLTGFQNADGNRWARPASVAIGADGEIYFTSDEFVQALYRLKKL